MSKELYDAFCIFGARTIFAMIALGLIIVGVPWVWRITSLQRYFMCERIRLEIALMRIKRYEKTLKRIPHLEREYKKAMRYLNSRPWMRGV